MIATCVHVKVKPERVDDFIEAIRKNHEGSVQEPGNLRFDISQQADDPTSFLLYEAYASPEAVSAHKETEHYHAWRQAVEPWMAEPRSAVKFNLLFAKNGPASS